MITHANERDALLRVEEVADELGQSKSAVYRKIAAGVIPSVRLGPDARFPLRVHRAELDAWLEGGRRTPGEEA